MSFFLNNGLIFGGSLVTSGTAVTRLRVGRPGFDS